MMGQQQPMMMGQHGMMMPPQQQQMMMPAAAAGGAGNVVGSPLGEPSKTYKDTQSISLKAKPILKATYVSASSSSSSD